VEELLSHHAGLQPWIPFYLPTLTGLNRPSPQLYRPMQEPGYGVPVTERLFMSDDYVGSVWKQIFNSSLRDEKDYKYSDLGLYISMRAVQNVAKRPLNVYVDESFYRPMGMATTTYLPWQRGWTDRCMPTEDDNYFRHGQIQGFVHDMGAAMLGGVSGHAGLFSNANDLAKLFQMLLNQGSYGGKQYIKPEVVRQFTTRWGESTRRGLGFDMKELDPKLQKNMSPLAGANTYGHTGFTGICAWADPDEQLIFIFLSNRTFPSMNNNKLINGDYRPRLQSIVYRALQEERNPLTNP
jgi:beta-N-acetylhexosaminidase